MKLEDFFVNDLSENKLGHIKIAIIREVINPLIIRSTDAESTISHRINEQREVVEIPARKFKSREKLFSLQLIRQIDSNIKDEKEQIIDKNYKYNLIKERGQLANINSVLFGDSITEGKASIGLPSRVVYDWAYSLRDVSDITDKLQHNALNENGTMWDSKKGDIRQSLFQVEYIKPPAYFPHFITLFNVNETMFKHLLYCVISQNRYGAQSTTTSVNMKNHIISIGFGYIEPPLNSYTISLNYNPKNTEEVTFDKVKSLVIENMKKYYSNNNILIDDKLNQLLENINKDLKNITDEKIIKEYIETTKLCEKFLKEIKVIDDKEKKESKSKSKSKSKK